MRTITVTGNALVKKVPELAYLSVRVHAKGATTKVAQKKQSELMHVVLGTLGKLTIASSDIKTERYHTQHAYKYDEKKRQQVPDGFVVMQQLTVTVVAESAEEVVGALAEHPVEITVGFGLKNNDYEKNDALCLAIANARAKAVSMANACDLRVGTLGEVISCNEGVRSQQDAGLRMVAMSVNPDTGGGTNPELPSGDIEIHATVTMTFELKYLTK